jgi:hypothetical protein
MRAVTDMIKMNTSIVSEVFPNFFCLLADILRRFKDGRFNGKQRIS